MLARLSLTSDWQFQHECLLRAGAATTSLVTMPKAVPVTSAPGRCRLVVVLGGLVERRDRCKLTRTKQSVDGFGRHLVRFAHHDVVVVMETTAMLRQLPASKPAPDDVIVLRVTSTPSCTNYFRSDQTSSPLHVMPAPGDSTVRVGTTYGEDISHQQYHTPRYESFNTRSKCEHFCSLILKTNSYNQLQFII